jgi:enediyne biosynthesis protein E4
MKRNRRRFIKSLSRTALVLPFAELAALARQQLPGPIERSYNAQARPAEKGPKSSIEGTPLGVSFVDVVKDSGRRENLRDASH